MFITLIERLVYEKSVGRCFIPLVNDSNCHLWWHFLMCGSITCNVSVRNTLVTFGYSDVFIDFFYGLG